MSKEITPAYLSAEAGEVPPTEEQKVAAYELIKVMTALVKDGEVDDDGHEFDMPNDDAYDTLHRLIEEARDIYWMEEIG